MTEIERRERGLKARVKRFYFDNPDEELTHALLRAKFGITKWTAVWLLRELVEEGILESVHVIRLRMKGRLQLVEEVTVTGEK